MFLVPTMKGTKTKVLASFTEPGWKCLWTFKCDHIQDPPLQFDGESSSWTDCWNDTLVQKILLVGPLWNDEAEPRWKSLTKKRLREWQNQSLERRTVRMLAGTCIFCSKIVFFWFFGHWISLTLQLWKDRLIIFVNELCFSAFRGGPVRTTARDNGSGVCLHLRQGLET